MSEPSVIAEQSQVNRLSWWVMVVVVGAVLGFLLTRSQAIDADPIDTATERP